MTGHGSPPREEIAGRGSPGYAGLAAAAAAAVIAVVVTVGGGSNATQFQAALSGTALAPGASAQVTLTQTQGGWRISLQGQGLPRLDNGYYYEAWLKNSAGILVPIGTFNQPNNVTLWAGCRPPSTRPSPSPASGPTVTRRRPGSESWSASPTPPTDQPRHPRPRARSVLRSLCRATWAKGARMSVASAGMLS